MLWMNITVATLMLLAYINTHLSPATVPYIAFLGLAYPILLLVHLFFILFWVFIKWKYVFISLLTVLIGSTHLYHFYAVNFSQVVLKDPLKIMSFNVRIFDLYNREGRVQNRDEIFDFLDEEAADILCFQEFYHQEQSVDFVTKDSMIQLLETPYYHERYTHEMTDKRYFGVATFSKYPIFNKGEIAFENDDNNFCIYSDIATPNETLRVFNAHLGSIRFQSDDYLFFGDPKVPHYPKDRTAGQRIVERLKLAFEKRALQAEKVAEEIGKSPYPVVVCGDLNDTPVSYCYRQFSDLLTDAFVASGNGVGQTYIGKVPSNRIDYIFYDKDFESANFTTHQVDFSDHKPISCQIGRKKE